jgi:2-(3-amino-3-carboxypropyl)histidine synthase
MDFEIPRIAKLVEETKARVIRLQFPEGLKRYGPDVAKRIQQHINVTVLLSGNPCYGACDLDSEADADLLVHFGHAEFLNLQLNEYILSRCGAMSTSFQS